MISLLIYIVVVAIIAGALAWLVQSAPFIAEPIRSVAVWGICAIAVLIIILKLAGVAGVEGVDL